MDKELASVEQEAGQREGERHQLIDIIVNGRKKQVIKDALTFEDVVSLAFPDATFSDSSIYTVTFARSGNDRPSGTLVEGEILKIKKGMVINVARTDKS